jgi:predicted porin
MNKKLIALAVAGAFVAPAAMAQTANPVTLYGKVYATFESISANGGTSAQNDATKNRSRVEDQASRLGVRGTEDLGGGLKAVFQLETAFRPDSNNTTFAARNSGVGLQGGWGTVMMGRWDTPWKVVTGALDPFGDVTIGGFKTVMNDQSNFDRRDQNVIQYWSPTWMGGLAVRLMAQANENKTASSDPKDYGGSVTWTGGPLYLMYAYEQHKDQVGNNGATAATAAGKKETGHALGGNFRFGGFLIGALYERIKKSDRADQKAWMANVVWTMGNNQLIYQYAQGKDGQVTGGTPLDCNSNVFGWQYNFSKRTFFLAQYAVVKNDNTASNCGSNTFNAAPFTIAGGQDPKGITLGISHTF